MADPGEAQQAQAQAEAQVEAGADAGTETRGGAETGGETNTETETETGPKPGPGPAGAAHPSAARPDRDSSGSARHTCGPAPTPGPPPLPRWLAERYEGWMREALQEASAAPATGDVPIGAVVVDATGHVVGRGRNRREADGDPVGHAEILALREAARAAGTWRLDGHTLVVTLEPCAMCAGAAVLARVGRIVFGAFDPKAGAVGSLWDIPRDPRLNHRPEVVPDILADEAAATLALFFTDHRGVR